MLVGFIAYKKDYINDNSSKKVVQYRGKYCESSFNFVKCSHNGWHGDRERSPAITAVIAVLAICWLLFLAIFVPMLFHVDKQSYGAYRVMTSIF